MDLEPLGLLEDKESTQILEPVVCSEYICSHYQRRCYIITGCCKKTYPCRLCHDDLEDHALINTSVENIKCALCNSIQDISNKCQKCGTSFGNYFCGLCRLFDDRDKKQYHCEGCGICRIGGRENYYHDYKCGMCYQHGTTHKCIENIALTRCPVCLQDLHTSTTPCIVNKCGHLIHKDCLEVLGEKMEYKCPICRKTILDYVASFYKDEIENTVMPPELRDLIVDCSCNDCGHNFKDAFHVIGNICPGCQSINTART